MPARRHSYDQQVLLRDGIADKRRQMHEDHRLLRDVRKQTQQRRHVQVVGAAQHSVELEDSGQRHRRHQPVALQQVQHRRIEALRHQQRLHVAEGCVAGGVEVLGAALLDALPQRCQLEVGGVVGVVVRQQRVH